VGPVVEATSEEEAIRIALEEAKDTLIHDLGYLPDPSELLAEPLEAP
jgi:hypothetical protein